MRDSAFNRMLKALLYFILVAVVAIGIIWSLGQTIMFSIPIMQEKFIGIIVGVFIQLSPTACLYMASSYNKQVEEEWGKWAMWMSAFWVLSLMDAFTNVGARFDRVSMNDDFDFGSESFANPEFAVYANALGLVIGLLIDFGIVFAEEVLGHFVSVFFDNLGELLRLVGQTPPRWFSMVATDRNRAGHASPAPKLPSPKPNKHPRGGSGGNQGQRPRPARPAPRPGSPRPGQPRRPGPTIDIFDEDAPGPRG